MLSEYLKGNIWRLEDCPFKLYFLLVQHLSFAYVAALSSLLLSPIFFSLFFCNAISKWCSVWLLELKNLIIFFCLSFLLFASLLVIICLCCMDLFFSSLFVEYSYHSLLPFWKVVSYLLKLSQYGVWSSNTGLWRK